MPAFQGLVLSIKGLLGHCGSVARTVARDFWG